MHLFTRFYVKEAWPSLRSPEDWDRIQLLRGGSDREHELNDKTHRRPDVDQKRHERRGHRELKEHPCRQENRGSVPRSWGCRSRSKWPKLIGSLSPSTLTTATASIQRIAHRPSLHRRSVAGLPPRDRGMAYMYYITYFFSSLLLKA